EQHEQLGPLGLIHGMSSFIERPADIGAGNRDSSVVDGHEGVLEGAVVEGQGALEEGLASEGNEPDAAVAAALHVIQDGQLGALQAAGGYVTCEHTAGAIQNEEGVLAEQVTDLRLLAPLRPRQG